MFNIKTHGFQYTDASIFCVGTESAIDLLHEYYKIHENNLDPNAFVDRIIFHEIHAYLTPNKISANKQCKRLNTKLKENKLLFDIKYMEEALLYFSPHKVVKALDMEEIYDHELESSDYLRSIFPELPKKFVITKEE